MTTPEEVVDVIENTERTLLLVVNSVCGCAAANARPGAKLALQNEKKPNRIATVFAGVDREATEKAREYLLPYPPSSPSIALFKDGKVVTMLERQIGRASCREECRARWWPSDGKKRRKEEAGAR